MSTPAAMNSHSASALHARLQAGTRAARERADQPAAPATARKRRIKDRDVWQIMNHLRRSASLAEPTLSCDRALRRILSLILEGSTHENHPVPLKPYADPVLVIRSGPWPVLRALLDQVAAPGHAPPVTLLCHRRDAAALEALTATTGVPIRPLYYPRFEPFNAPTLQRVLHADRGPWAATFVLDASRTGTGHALEHITTALTSLPGDQYVWNGSGQLFQLQSLRDTLGRDEYEIVRRLLRWRAARTATG